MLGFGAIGIIDDWMKISNNSSSGLNGKIKILLQILIAFPAIMSVIQCSPQELQNEIAVPFFKDFFINLGFLFIPFSIFVVVGASNSVNLTDGLDGLAIVPVIIAASCFALIAYLVGNVNFSSYLQLNYVPGVGEISILLGALLGAGLGFLWFNAPPAEIFMGDTGSLSLGGALGISSVATRHELVLVIIGGIFVVETISVILQVSYFKLTGKRIFLMAPLHHHFEKRGWAESTIVIRFWIIAVILALIGLSTLKLR
jgi:phospho-N-acetylmuramoyl-pentapeptide-transferase